MKMDAIEIYKSHETPPTWAQKTITGGRLTGKTDINPQWRYLALTQMFGLCGFGWKYEVTNQWLEKGENGEIVAFVNINLFVKVGENWSEPIPGNGGSMFIAKESKGLFTSDEAYKMATTDALSVACKMLGIGATIYSGSKYIPEIPKPQPAPEKPLADLEIMLECAEIGNTKGKDAARAFISKFKLTDAQKAEMAEASKNWK